MKQRLEVAAARMRQINELDRQTQKHPELLAQLAAFLERAASGENGVSGRRAAKKKKKSDRISYYDEDELAALFAAIRDGGSVRDMAIFEVALGRGLRASEVGLITMERLRLKDRRLFVERLKNGISNEYLLFDREVKALKAWVRERGDQRGVLFASNKKKPISQQRLDQMIRGYAAAAKIISEEKRHFHCLRHTCATRLLEKGQAIEQVKDHLGHRDIRNTMIYAQITDRSRKALAKQLAAEW